MKNFIKKSLPLITMIITLSVFSSCTNEDVQINTDLKNSQPERLVDGTNDCSCIDEWPASISPEETALVLHMREEEKLARDVYAYLYNQHNLNIFNNISNSEQQHMNSILCILEQYNIEDPVVNEAGVFSNSELQELYNSLIEQGSASLMDALVVGATIEDLDIYDLDVALSEVQNSAIDFIFNNLRCGSYNHMRAFNRQIERNDGSYTPQFISNDDYIAILNGELGDCNNSGNGNGQGNGNGNGNRNGKGKGNRMGNGNGMGNGNCDGTGPGRNR
jgi:hypothetical protein